MVLIKHIIVAVLVLTLTLGQTTIIFAESRISHRERQIREQELKMTEESKKSTDQITDTSGLDDYIRIGLKHNPELKMSFYQWKASVKKISEEFSLPDPRFSYTDYSKESDKEEAYSVSQMIPWPEKVWIKRTKAAMGSDEAYYDFKVRRLELVRQITEAYYEYAYLSKAVLITRENMKLLGNFEGVAQAKYSSGLTRNQDLLKIQVELGKLENELTSMEDMRRPLMARLIALLNLSVDAQLPWPPDSLEDVSMNAAYEDVAALIKNVQSNNPELAAVEKNVNSEQEGLKLAKREYIPDFMVTLTQEKMRPEMSSRGDPSMIMFSVNVPLWFGRINAEIQGARASLQAAEANRENKSNEIESMFSMAHYRLRDALRQSLLYKNALIPKAVQTLNATKSAYESGGMDFLSLIDALRMLLDFQMAYYRHNADFYQQLAGIQALLGDMDMVPNNE